MSQIKQIGSYNHFTPNNGQASAQGGGEITLTLAVVPPVFFRATLIITLRPYQPIEAYI